MKVNGMQIKLMVMYMSFLYSRVHISTWMEPNMKDNGWMINKMEWARKFGLMVQDTRVIISREKNTEVDNFFGLMDLSMRENSNSIIFKELAFTSGQTVVNMMVNGKIIKWMERGYRIYQYRFLLGMMDDNIMGSTRMIRNMDMEFLSGLIKEYFGSYY